MRSNWLYLAMRSLRLAEPVLIWPGAEADGEVGNEGVFGFARAVRDHRGVAVAAAELDGADGFRHRANLVQLDQNRIGHAFFDAARQPLRVGHEDIVSDQLNLAAQLLGEQRPAFPIVLREAVLDG